MKRFATILCLVLGLALVVPVGAWAYLPYDGWFAHGYWRRTVPSNGCSATTYTYWAHNWDYGQQEGFRLTGVRGTWSTSTQSVKKITLDAHEYGTIDNVAQKSWDVPALTVAAPSPSVSNGVKTYTYYRQLYAPTLGTPTTMTEVAWGSGTALLYSGKSSSTRAGVGQGSTSYDEDPVWRVYSPRSSQCAGKVLGVDSEAQLQFNDTANRAGLSAMDPTQLTIRFDAKDYATAKRAKPGTVLVDIWFYGPDADRSKYWNTVIRKSYSTSAFTKSVSSDGKTTTYKLNINVSDNSVYPRLITESSLTGMSWGADVRASVIDASGRASATPLRCAVNVAAGG